MLHSRWIMKFLKYVLCVFLLVSLETSAVRTCEDCDNIINCPLHANYMPLDISEKVRKLKAAFCGFDGNGTKVCCSDFSDQIPDEVESHPNLKLLSDDCGYIDGNRIIGGSIASLYEFPWMALISYKTGDTFAFQCAGSVINSRYILTAAHCIKNLKIAGIRVGEFDLRYSFDCQTTHDGKPICESHVQDIRVEETKCHEKYEGYPKYAYDIGLIRLQTPINFSYKNAVPICLPISKELRSVPLADKKATVAGWGLTENNRESSVLLKVVVPIYSDYACIDFYSRILEPSETNKLSIQFCAGSENKDSCDGDSGAPLMIEEKYKGVFKFIQYGIVSQGRAECGSETPAVYTAVPAYMKWILDTIRA